MKRTVWFVLASFALLLVVLTLVASGSTPSASAQGNPTPPPDLAAIVRQLYDAGNKGDATAAAAFFTDDPTYVRGACSALSPCRTKAEIIQALQIEAGNKAQYTVVNLQVSGHDVTGRLEWRSIAATNADIDRVIVKVAVTFTGDKISRLAHELDLSDPETAIYSNYYRVVNVTNGVRTALLRGDEAATMTFYADDAVFQGLGLCAPMPCAGKAAIQKEMERQVADKINLNVVLPATYRVSGDIQSVQRFEIRSDSIKATGVERIIVWQTMQNKGTKIASQRLEPDLADAQTVTYMTSLNLPADYLNTLRHVGVLYQHYNAINAADADATLALLTPAASIARGGCAIQTPCLGTEAIQVQLSRDKLNRVRYTVLSLQVAGDTVTGRVAFTNILVKTAGFQRVIEKITVTFQGDKIAKLVHELDVTDPDTAAYINVRRVIGITTAFTDPLSLGNLTVALASLTEDAVFEGPVICSTPAPCTGKAVLQKELERWVADKVQFTTAPASIKVTGDVVTSRAEVTSTSVKAAGVERIIVNSTVETKNGKVSAERWVLNPSDAQTATYAKTQPR